MDRDRLVVSRPVSGPAEPLLAQRADEIVASRPGPGPAGSEGPGPRSGGTVRPSSTFVYGSSRELVNLLLFAIAVEGDSSVHWLDIRRTHEPSSPFDPASLGWVDEGHLWTVDPGEALGLDSEPAGAALFKVVRDDEPPETLRRLTDFLRLPRRVQRILAETPAAGERRTLAVANADRAQGAFPEASLPPILQAVAWAGLSLAVGFYGSPPVVRRSFDAVVRVEGESVRRWGGASLTVEQGQPWGATRPGTRVPLSEVPSVARTIRRALADT